MNRILAILLLLTIAVCPALALDEDKPITKEIALKAIALFRADPGSDEAMAASAIILRFAEVSPEVKITVSKDVLPWLGENPYSKYESELIVAYIAGSTQAQLLSGKANDEKLAGILLVNETYLVLQKREPNLHIESIEKLIELQKQGKLKESLEAK